MPADNAVRSFSGAPTIIERSYAAAFADYIEAKTIQPLLLLGDVLEVMAQIPDNSIDFCMTSPPYWGKREYNNGGIGLEPKWQMFVESMTEVSAQVFRVLKPTGSYWLNIGDTYEDKQLLGIPWRVAFSLTDKLGFTLRNSVIWNKVKGGPDNTTDRLRTLHELVFHFVKSPKKYYYDADAIRSTPAKAKVVNGAIISATGVSGVRYRRQIELSTSLTEAEKQAAFSALEKMLDGVQKGTLADFRMIIRGQQRVTHSDSERVSGRAKELKEKGFYFLRYHPNGAKPGDVWDILPEDTQKRESHFAPYPVDLCRIPILATCPPDGIVLDPFAGTGTTLVTARLFGRKSVGIDISAQYLKLAQDRLLSLL
jgi:DNA modification methylase